MKNIFPVFIENSALPVVLSRVSPINIWAINLGLFVFCREKLSKQTKNHETIHYKQTLELLFVGFWLLYFIFWVIGLFRYRDGAVAYMMIPFEKEAYSNEENLEYLSQRKSYSWVKYVGREKA
jgi:hypothetical protein|tara:strand:+ start:146 stop:514 length:369 start_codon:yes stop_codon:yes gene_type:complete